LDEHRSPGLPAPGKGILAAVPAFPVPPELGTQPYSESTPSAETDRVRVLE
jgi:hypothetical protein